MISPELPPFTLPLTRDQFAQALAHGLGRARLHINRHGAAGMEDLIVDACLYDRSFDPQCEDDRATWMAELVTAAGLEETIVPAIVRGLQDLSEAKNRDATHRCRVAARLAAQGHTAARDALYDAFRRSVDADEPIDTFLIVELDGLAGVVAVVEAFGRRLTVNPQLDIKNLACLYYFDEKRDAGAVHTELQRAAIQHPDIQRFLDRVPLPPDEQPTPRPARPLAEMLAEIDASNSHLSQAHFRYWGKRATDDDLRVIAERVRAVREPGALRKSLACFGRRPYPALLPEFLSLAEHGDERVRRAAIDALAQLTHPEVRALALSRLAAGRVTEGEIGLLQQNHVPGDEAIIARALTGLPDRESVHYPAMDALDVFEANPSVAAKQPLLWIYEHTPCSICRGGAVARLINQNGAPPWLLEEGRFDVDERTRELCAEQKGAGW